MDAEAFLAALDFDDRHLMIPSRPPSLTSAAATDSALDVPRFLAINREINAISDLTTLLDLILDTAIDLVRAERGFLLLREGESVVVKAARHFDREALSKQESELSLSLAKGVMERGEPLIIADAQKDQRSSELTSVQAIGIRSVICIPLPAAGSVIGVLYFDSRLTAGTFKEEDLALLAAFADQAGIVIEKVRLLQEARQAKEAAETLNRQLQRRERQLAQMVEQQKVELKETRQALERRQSQMEQRYRYDHIIGKSPRMQEVYRLLDRVAGTDLPVLIQGETGTGKELVAKTIHYNSPRKAGEFVSINCAAMPETLLESELFGHARGAFTGADRDKPGLFEVADGGTLFLDEIADMPAKMQMVLLRVLQEKEIRRVGAKKPVAVDVRLVSASQADLEAMVSQGRFREDLFYRLQGIALTLPPLRERVEDVRLLIAHFLQVIAEEEGSEPRPLTRAAERALCAYPWPGNVRELEHELRRAAALEERTIDLPALSDKIRRPPTASVPSTAREASLSEILDETERRVIKETLEACGGNKTEAARRLGIPVRTLYNHLKRLGLDQ
jgi:transcriptional regulator with GAF, ATPase, and Fis domain